jgi:hypothetical protein
MKHFAKYLPVEGEIKEGDTVLLASCDEIYTYDKKVVTLVPRDKKVKLFLCSRDIQVGDKISIEGVTESTIYGGQNLSSSIKEGKVFKVIGEISPEATWVKDGDKFEKSDIKVVGYGENWSKHQNLSNIKVKGPCGHFH